MKCSEPDCDNEVSDGGMCDSCHDKYNAAEEADLASQEMEED